MNEWCEIFCDSKITIVPHPLDNKTLSQKVALEKNVNDDQDPFFVVNLTTLIRKFAEFKRELPNVKPFYAVKCIDDPVILTVLAKLGCGFDCASEKEISKVLKLNITHPEKIIFANPCKPKKAIKLANTAKINMMTFDSAEELSKVKLFHENPEMILRIAIDDPTALDRLGAKFGCDPKIAPELLEQAKHLGINVMGIAFHIGSGCRQPETFVTAFYHARNLFDIGKKMQHTMKILDIGAGFPGVDTQEVNFAKIASIIRDSIKKYFPNEREVTIISEPGRFFGCSPISKAVNIISSIRVPANRITKDEGDSNKIGYMYFVNQGVYGTFSCKIFENCVLTGEPLFPDPKDNKEVFDTVIWGPTCAGNDQVEEYTKMRHLERENWLYYPNVGAYNAVTASTFNGIELPKFFYFIDELSWRLIQGDIDK